MKRTLFAIALALVFTVPSYAAIHCDYVQKTVTEGGSAPPSDLTARAIIDGARSRVDFVGGNAYPPGTYVISTDGARYFFVDPVNKWFTEVNAAGTVSAIGASNIRIENVQSDVQKLDDRPLVAGVATDHYQLTINYDITLVMRSIPLKQKVNVVIDTYSTPLFGDVGRIALASTIRTGNADIDRILDFETTKVPGFPMRQVVTTRTTFVGDRPAKSQLEINPTRVVTREMRVTSIRESAADANAFIIPAGFVRADTPDLPRSATQVLTFEPTSK